MEACKLVHMMIGGLLEKLGNDWRSVLFGRSDSNGTKPQEKPDEEYVYVNSEKWYKSQEMLGNLNTELRKFYEDIDFLSMVIGAPADERVKVVYGDRTVLYEEYYGGTIVLTEMDNNGNEKRKNIFKPTDYLEKRDNRKYKLSNGEEVDRMQIKEVALLSGVENGKDVPMLFEAKYGDDNYKYSETEVGTINIERDGKIKELQAKHLPLPIKYFSYAQGLEFEVDGKRVLMTSEYFRLNMLLGNSDAKHYGGFGIKENRDIYLFLSDSFRHHSRGHDKKKQPAKEEIDKLFANVDI